MDIKLETRVLFCNIFWGKGDFFIIDFFYYKSRPFLIQNRYTSINKLQYDVHVQTQTPDVRFSDHIDSIDD